MSKTMDGWALMWTAVLEGGRREQRVFAAMVDALRDLEEKFVDHVRTSPEVRGYTMDRADRVVIASQAEWATRPAAAGNKFKQWLVDEGFHVEGNVVTVPPEGTDARKSGRRAPRKGGAR